MPSPWMRGAVKVSSVMGREREGVGTAVGVGSGLGTTSAAAVGAGSVVSSSLSLEQAARNARVVTVRPRNISIVTGLDI